MGNGFRDWVRRREIGPVHLLSSRPRREPKPDPLSLLCPALLAPETMPCHVIRYARSSRSSFRVETLPLLPKRQRINLAGRIKIRNALAIKFHLLATVLRGLSGDNK